MASFQPNPNAKEFRPSWMAPPYQQQQAPPPPAFVPTNQYQEYLPVATQGEYYPPTVTNNKANPNANYMLTDEEFAEYDKWVEERRAAGLPVDDDDYFDDEGDMEEDISGDDLDEAERAWMEEQVASAQKAGEEAGEEWRPPAQEEKQE